MQWVLIYIDGWIQCFRPILYIPVQSNLDAWISVFPNLSHSLIFHSNFVFTWFTFVIVAIQVGNAQSTVLYTKGSPWRHDMSRQIERIQHFTSSKEQTWKQEKVYPRSRSIYRLIDNRKYCEWHGYAFYDIPRPI